MKPRNSCLYAVLFVTIASSIFSPSDAANLYWDGTDSTSDADGGAGSWTTGGSNWDDAATAGIAAPWANNDIAIFGVTAGAVTLGGPVTADGLTFNSTGYTVSGNTLTLGANPVTVTTAGHSATISSVLAGSAGLTKLGAGTLVLAADNNYTGGTTISVGTLSFSNSNQLEGATSIASGALLEFNPTGSSNTVANAFTGSGTIKVNMAGAAAGGLTMGGTSIDGFTGTIQLAAAAATGDKLIMNGQNTAANIIVGNGTSLYKTGPSATIGSLSIVGSGNNENRGAIRLETGTLTVTNGTTLQGNTTFGTSGATLVGTIRGTATSDNTQTLTLGAINTNGGATLTNAISDGVNGGKLALNIGAVNMGDVSIQGVNTYSGGTTVNFGRVSIGANGSALGTGTVTIHGDGIVGDGQVYAGTATLANNFIISGFGGNTGDATQRGAIRLDGGTINGSITLAGNAAIGANSGTGTINGQITGGFFLRKVDGGIISLTNATNAYTGGTQVTGGTLSFSNGALGTTGNISMAAGTLRWNAGNTQDVSNRLVRNGGTVSYDTNGNDVTFALGIGTGTSMVNKTGAGTLTLTSYNSSTGGIEVLGGTLSVSNIADTGTSSQIGNLTSNHIAAKNGSTLRYTGLADASTARNLWVDTGVGGTIEVTNAATTLSFTGIGGNINKILTKTGAGTLTIADDINSAGGGVTVNAGSLNLTNSNNSYTGATTINGGTLVFGGSVGAGTGASATTIGGGGTLKLDNSSASIGNRFGAGAITLNGGTIQYLHNGAAATNYSETLGALTIGNGVNTVATSQAAPGQTSTLTFDSLSQTNGSVNFVGTGLGPAIDPTNEISFTSPPALVAGAIGTWATINGSDLATVVGGSVVSYTGYTDIDALGSTIVDGATTNIRIFGNGIGGNISLGSAPTTVHSLTMSNGTNAATVDTFENILITSGIFLASGAQALTIGAAADDGTLQVNSAGGNLTLNNQSLTNALTINAVIADNTSASGLTKVGPGLVTLAGTNSYTGVTAVGEGVLAVSSFANGGVNSGIGAATVAQSNLVLNNGTLRYTGNTVASDRGFSIAAGSSGTIDVSTPGQTLTVSGGIAATTGSLVKTGSGILLLNGQSQFTGSTMVNGGMLAVDGNQVNNRLTNNNQVFINNGGTFEVRGVNAIPGGGNAVDVSVNSGGIFSVVTGGSTAIGAGGQSHAHIRNLTLGGGTVNFSYSGAGSAYNNESFQLNGILTVTGSAASTIQSSGTTATTGLALNGTNVFTVNDVTGNSNVDLTISAELENNDSAGDGLLKNGAGTMTLSGANSYTGVTTVSAGRLISGNTSATSSSIISSGAVLELNHTTGTRSYNVNTSFSGTGTLEKTGAGNINYSAAATFQMGSGALIDVRQGTFTAANGANEKWRTGAGTLLSPYVYNLSDLNVESGAIFDGVEASATGDGGIFVDELRGTGTIQVGYAGGYSNTLTFGIDNGTASFGGTLGGNSFGNYVKTGTGTQTLTGTSTSTGTMTVNGGTLALEHASNGLADSMAVSLGGSSAVLSIGDSKSDTVGTLDVVGAATIQLGTGSALAFANSSSISWTGGALNLTGAFVSGVSIRFGINAAALTPTQLLMISADGYVSFSLNPTGFLVGNVSSSYNSWLADFTFPESADTSRNGDPDNDGFTNLQEFLFGTNPTTQTGALSTTEKSGNELFVRWKQRTAGATYTLLESDTLNGDWLDALIADPLIEIANDGPVAGNYQPRIATIPIGNGKDFFQVEGIEE